MQILRALAHRIDPRDAGAHNNLGVVYYRKGLLQEAIDAFERALALDPRMGVAERNLRIAYSHEGYFERLVAGLEADLARAPDDRASRARLARAHQHAGNAEAARAHWADLLERAPDDPQVALALSRTESDRGELEAALRVVDEACARGVKDPRLELQAGELLYQLARPRDARDRLQGALALDDGLAAAHHLLAFIYGDLGLAEEAAAAGARAEELNPSYGRAEANLSLDAYNSARYEELVGARAAAPALVEGTLAHYNLGLAFREKGLLAEAEREFGLAAARGEDVLMVRQAQAELFLLRGDGERAIPLYEEAIEIEPDSPKLWNERGVAAHQVGDLEGAERAYLRALDVDPRYVLARNNLAVARVHADDPAEAERVFADALEHPGAPGEVWRNHALALTRTGWHEAAERAYRTALERDAGSAVAWAGLGTSLLALQRHDDARAALVHSVQLDPELAEARYQLAFALSALGDYQGALRETRLALELDPLFPAPRFRLLIDLQFEEAGVPAPELGGERRFAGEAEVEEFRFESEALAEVFASLEGGEPAGDRAEGAAPATAQPAEYAAAPPDTPAAPPETFGARPGGAPLETFGARPGDSPAEIAGARPGGSEDGDSADPLAAARRALDRGDLHQVHVAARRAADEGAARADVLLVRAHAFLRQGFAGEALERYQSVLSEEAGGELPAPARTEAELGCALALLDLGRSQEALASAAELASATGDPRAMRAHGRALAANERPAEAAEVLERALEASETDRAGIALDAGYARLAAGRGADAERLFRVALSLEPEGPAVLTGLGRALASLGHDDDAATALRAALQVLPTYAEAALSLAGLQRRLGRSADAIAILADFLFADPYHFDGLHRLGEYLAGEERYEDAATAFRRVLAFDPANERARAALEHLGLARVAAGAA